MQKLFLVMAGCLIFMATFSGTPKQNRIIPARFSHPGIIRYNHDGFIINGKPVFIYSGSFHYFRCDSTDWMDRLQKIKAAGFNTIETYVPWNWHERQEGKTNFEPLERFLDDCQQVGLYVIVRPGPYICAEWNVGGFPTWLEGKDVGFRTASPAD
ncbi:MAG: beta-galactosidase, partial [Bacteroidetes bacterium]|nr:beta-galactosidase [Bacteroidota bacterium]